MMTDTKFIRKRKRYANGNRFGKLTVIKRLDKRTPQGNVYYLCKCDCGNIKEMRSSQLGRSKGGTKSCGCLKKLPLGEAARNDLLGNYRGRAREWNLTDD